MTRVALVLALAAAGCGGVEGRNPDGGDGLQVFVAAASNFVGFTKWTSFSFQSDGTTDGLTHVSGHRIVYIDPLPPKGSKTFPVGTIIVKQIQPGEANAQTFAMAKRGGVYNSSGAPGWEWFELDPTLPDTTPMLRWRGVAPPAGENYSGSPNGTCNDCHGADTANDSVLATQLSLSNL
jgi:hypothetical protein